MSSAPNVIGAYSFHDLGPMELTEELTATLTTPILLLSCCFEIKNFYVSSPNSSERSSEEDWNIERWRTVHDLHCFTHSLSLAKLSIRGMMTQTSAWVRLPLDIREIIITKIASYLMEYWLNEGSNPALGYALIPCFQLRVILAMIIDDVEELNFRLAAQQSFDAAQQQDDVHHCHLVFATLLESLVTEIVGEVEDDKEECVICQDEFVTGTEVKRLPCSHRFHEQCITHWFQEKNTCPLCRQSIQV